MLSSRHVLDEERVPDEDLVVHRRDELDRLMAALRPGDTWPTDLMFLIGPTGTGKTMLSKLAFDLLEQDGEMPEFESAYVNCWRHDERRDILLQTVDQLCRAPVHENATGRSELISHLEGDPGHPQYLVLDEVDQLHDKDVLYDLHSVPVNLILVANREEDLFAGMADRLKSRLSVGRRIECGAYADREVAAILSKRAEYVLGRSGSRWDERDMMHIAEHCDGDARVGVRTLRIAIEEDGEVPDDVVERILPQARDRLRQKSRDQLTDHQEAVLCVVEEFGPITTNGVMDQYRDRVDDARTKRTVQTYLSKLEQYNHVERAGPDNKPEWSAVEYETV